MITQEGYQHTAQLLIDAHALEVSEYGRGDSDYLRYARKLYETHGPFELEFYNWDDSQLAAMEEWYD